MKLLEIMLGRRLANREAQERKIGAYEGVPAMGLDGFASSAYGPEAALSVLAVLGAAGVGYIGYVMIPILILLAILFASYWQTIRAYPANGGAYVVARQNLGENAGLLAAAALMIDYILNVAVGISAGVAALISAVPQLHAHLLALCLGILAFVTLMNLRGTREASRLFAIPTYLFLICFCAVLAIGIVRTVGAHGHPQPVVSPPAAPQAAGAATLWLLMKAFAGGCTAMTGVEAVSNGVDAFREPAVRYAHRTLGCIVAALGALLAGIAYLASAYHINAMDQSQNSYRSVLSQLVSAVAGNGVFYYVAIGSLLCVLVLSANTSFVGFPGLCRSAAQDGFMPRPFAIAGHRLMLSAGILFLAATAAVLLIVFGGITERLIPLFAIGAFLTFTMSQTGMVMHWLRRMRDTRERKRSVVIHLLVSAVGAIATAVALLIICIAKFVQGAWITIVATLVIIIILKAVRYYYDELGARVREASPLRFSTSQPPIVVVAIDEWNQLADRTVMFAMTISRDVVGVHLSQLEGPGDETQHEELQQQWNRDVVAPATNAGLPQPRLLILHAQYRSIHEPVLRVVQEIRERFSDRAIAVLIPELIKQHWYQHLLHTSRARRLREQLLRHGGACLTIVSVPWYLEPTTE